MTLFIIFPIQKSLKKVMLKTSVVYICFNRPSITKKTFEKIRSQKPKKLFLIMDGPRLGNKKDLKNCKQVKKIICKIDWKCKVYKNFSINNLGLKKRVISGLNWVFEKVDKAIILEDDCYPSNDFFYFCETLLNFYEKNKRISIITGNNFQTKPINSDSYYFSKYSHIWGWATWKRTWKLFNDNDKNIEKFLKSKKFQKISKIRAEQNYWKNMFDQIKNGSLKSWAYYFLLNIWEKGGLTVTPNFNLIENLGISSNSSSNKIDSNLKISITKTKLNVSLAHPKSIMVNENADNQVFYSIYKKNIKTRLKYRLKKMINYLK